MTRLSKRTVRQDSATAATRLSPEAFAEVFTDWSRTLWCIAAGVLGSRDLAEDVLQEGAIIALRKLDQFDPDTSFVAWMGRIVRYVALNHARKRQRTPTSTVDPASLSSMADSPPQSEPAPTDARGRIVNEQESFDDDVLRALDGLEEVARSCVLLRTVMDLPYREISLALDIPEGTAMSHVHRARRFLREKLHDRAPSTVGREFKRP